MDEVGLLRRLIQKGNMQMRLVTLEQDWYEKDSGVMIGADRQGTVHSAVHHPRYTQRRDPH